MKLCEYIDHVLNIYETQFSTAYSFRLKNYLPLNVGFIIIIITIIIIKFPISVKALAGIWSHIQLQP